jgi:hypothetical protein
MTDPQTIALISRLERAQRHWKRLAQGALTALFLVLLTGSVTAVLQQQRIRATQARAEQAMREAEEQRQQVQRMLYANQIGLAQQALESQHRDHNP